MASVEKHYDIEKMLFEKRDIYSLNDQSDFHMYSLLEPTPEISYSCENYRVSISEYGVS